MVFTITITFTITTETTIRSYLNVMDFPSAESLAQEMIRLAGNDTAYLEYFWWKVIGDDHVVGDDDGDDGDVGDQDDDEKEEDDGDEDDDLAGWQHIC